MLGRVPVLDSQVIRALIVAGVGVVGIVCSFFGVDEALFSSEKVQRLADGVATLATLVGVVWAAWARTTKPTPPLTQAAEDATKSAIAAGKLTNGKQGGFLRPLVAVVLLAVAAAFTIGAAGCSGTRAAYEAAATRSETRLEDYAYVVAEHYRAIVREAADLKAGGRVSAPVLERMQAADRRLKPIVLGDPAATPPRRGLRELAAAFRSARTAETEADLQRAVDDAVLALADFIKAVDAARSTT